MPTNHSAPLPVSELSEIGLSSYQKAGKILSQGEAHFKSFEYDLAVRHGQESFEHDLKSLFRFLRSEYPPIHDQEKQIYALTKILSDYQINMRRIARLVLANSVLDLWRLSPFYGDEK
jgi:HEPN domain-containing protein